MKDDDDHVDVVGSHLPLKFPLSRSNRSFFKKKEFPPVLVFGGWGVLGAFYLLKSVACVSYGKLI